MTDTDGLLRDAGGPRKASDVDALIERMEDIAHDRSGSDGEAAEYLYKAAAVLAELQAENARLDRVDKYALAAVSGVDKLRQRIAALEAERDAALKAINFYKEAFDATAALSPERALQLLDVIEAAEKMWDYGNQPSEEYKAALNALDKEQK